MRSLENSTPMEQIDGVDRAITRYHRRVTVTRLILLITIVIEFALGVRLVMKLIAVDPESYVARFRYNLSPAVAEFVYAATDPLILPFSGITTNASAEGSVLEIPTLLAMLAYVLVGWVIGRIILGFFEKRLLSRLRDSIGNE